MIRKIETDIPGIWIIEPDVFSDDRGFFFESYNQSAFAEIGITDTFVQDNHSKSIKGTLRGLHYQLRRPQAKLCRVIRGKVLDVAVDIRVGSPYFKQYVTSILSEDNKRLLYIPPGFAHGFLTLSNEAEFLYKCSSLYDRDDEHGLSWNDPQTNIDWGIGTPRLSLKDSKLPQLLEIATEELPGFSPAN